MHWFEGEISRLIVMLQPNQYDLWGFIGQKQIRNAIRITSKKNLMKFQR